MTTLNKVNVVKEISNQLQDSEVIKKMIKSKFLLIPVVSSQ